MRKKTTEEHPREEPPQAEYGKNQRWHNVLEEVLQGGTRDEIAAVTGTLKLAAELVRARTVDRSTWLGRKGE